MATFTFDAYNQNEIPVFTLANPDGVPLYNMGTIYERNFSLKFNALSELTFTAPSQVDKVPTDYYDSIQYRRLVLVEGIGNFMITAISIENDGLVELKKVTCQSAETMLSNKKISLFEGVYKLYDPDAPVDSLMTQLLGYIPGWNLGTVDDSLLGIWRTFQVADKTLYDFMVNEISQTYQCIFIFDTINKLISIYAIANATEDTDIFISFDNLMKSFTIEISTEEMATALNVIGGENLDISIVNPLGTSTIYNFDYYQTSEWMSQGLIDAIDVWESKIAFYQPTYADLLTDLTDANATLLAMQTDLINLQNTLAALQQTKLAAQQAKAPAAEIAAIDAQINATNELIAEKQSDITQQQVVVSGIQSQLAVITNALSFANNFTQEELIELDNYIIGNTYTNTNFLQTTVMTSVDIQAEAQGLYGEGVKVLAKVSQPRYTFAMDAANFLFIKGYEPFIAQLSMGCTITVEVKEGVTITPVILAIDFSYDDPTAFKVTLSNRLRLDNQEFQYSDLFSSLVDAGTTTNFNSQKWNSTSSIFGNIRSSGSNLVASSSKSSITGNIAVFSNTDGTAIADSGGLYTTPASFAPALICEGDSFTYNYQTGLYSIVGKICEFQLALSLGGVSGTSTSPVYIDLPIYAKSMDNLYSAFAVSYQGITTSASSTLVGVLEPGDNRITLMKMASTQLLNPILGTALNPTTTKIYMSGNYFID